MTAHTAIPANHPMFIASFPQDRTDRFDADPDFPRTFAVTYVGSLSDRHGQYFVYQWCTCWTCEDREMVHRLLDPDAFPMPEPRVTLVDRNLEEVLVHVSLDSLRVHHQLAPGEPPGMTSWAK